MVVERVANVDQHGLRQRRPRPPSSPPTLLAYYLPFAPLFTVKFLFTFALRSGEMETQALFDTR